MKRMCLLATAVVFLAVSVDAAVIRVPQDQPTVQSGLSAAEPGDTVLVDEGIYLENVTWPATPDVTLKGAGAPESVIIDGNRAGRVIRVEMVNDSVTIESVTLRRGLVDTTPTAGGGLYASNANVTMTKCIIHDNIVTGQTGQQSALLGGGVYATQGNLTLERCLVAGNMLLQPLYGSTHEVQGGGVHTSNSAYLAVFDSTIIDNISDGDDSCGGALSCCQADIENCLIVYNRARYAAGICLVSSESTAEIRISTITANMNDGIPDVDITAFGTLVIDSSIIGKVSGTSAIRLDYSCYQSGGDASLGPGSFTSDPLFVEGPYGPWYLSNMAASQNETSPCVDTGNPSIPPGENTTTRTDHIPDSDIIDIGYHYDPDQAPPTPPQTPTPSPTPDQPTPTPSPTPTSPAEYPIALELIMPHTVYAVNTPFYLDIHVDNSGSSLFNAQMFVALTIGTGDFWFYPGWVRFPPELNHLTVGIPALSSDTWNIIPEFLWPDGTGAFDGAMFFAAILDDGTLMSNLAYVTFGWTE